MIKEFLNMRFFEKQIDLRSRKEMTDFLKSHFRYNTMNGWNRSTSYANSVKLYQLELEKGIYDRAYIMIHQADFIDSLNELLSNYTFDKTYDVGFNGRSNGYIVMYKKRNGQVFPGASIDQDEDFKDWDLTSLRNRVKEVISFDRLCDKVRDKLIEYCQNFDIKEETIMVPRNVSVLVETIS
jgi:hypothetical protein